MRGRLWILLPMLLAGCALGEGGGSIEVGQLQKMVLQQEDLPGAFVRFDEGRQARTDIPGGARSDPARFGRLDGWKARYRRPATAQTKGPLVVESRVDLFESSGGADDELDAIAETGFVPLEAPDLGDEAKALESRQGSVGSGVQYYLIAWREDNATASLLISGFQGRFSLEEALALARKQAARVSSAAA